jgi:hypothetical protein
VYTSCVLRSAFRFFNKVFLLIKKKKKKKKKKQHPVLYQKATKSTLARGTSLIIDLFNFVSLGQ